MKSRLLYVLLFIASISLAQIPTTNLESSYEFTSGSLNDGTGSNNFTQTGAALTKVNDRFTIADNAISLNGDYLTGANSSFSDFTLSFWIKTSTNDANLRTILNKSFKTGADFTALEFGMFVYLKNGKIGFIGRHSQDMAPGGRLQTPKVDVANSVDVADGNWHHIAITLDREYNVLPNLYSYQLVQDINVYVDGVVKTTQIKHPASLRINNPVNANTNFKLANNVNGALAVDNKYQDIIDDIYIYTSVLNATEVAALGNTGGYCYAPFTSDFSVINTTATASEVVLPAGGKSYDIAYVEDGQPFSGATILTGINASKQVLDLQPSKTYNVYIREYCTAANIVSNWSLANQITTLSGVIYVNPSATSGNNDGTSWSDGYTSLQAALDAFTTGEIWVKGGTYKPHASDQTAKFTISKENTVLFGGFAGTETSLSQRDFRANTTILSGDLLGNDDANITFANNTRSDNSDNILTLGEAADNTIIDGFTIEGADSTTEGAAINKHVEAEKIILRNLTIRNNVARNSSAGIRAPLNTINDKLDIINSKFENNLSTYHTALYVFFGKSNSKDGYVNVHNALFANNKIADEATRKGASGIVTLFSNNSGKLYGKFYNNTFVNNTDMGTESGVQKGVLGTSRPTPNPGYAYVTVYNSIFWNNLNAAGDNLPLNGKIKSYYGYTVTTEDTMINIDPKFTDQANGDYTLQNNSLALNTGNNSNLSSDIVTDLAGNARLVGGNVDKGCYENTSGVSIYNSRSNILVKPDALGTNDGTSWANAFTTINEAIAVAKLYPNITEIWIAKGTYKPHTSDRTKSFNLDVPNVTFYGGFAGTEANLNSRDESKIHTDNEVVLSGDLQGNDDANITFANTTRSDNSIHVVTIAEENITLDGITISDGSYEEGTNNSNYKKGAAIFKNTAIKVLSLNNCILKNNVAFLSAGINLDYNDTANTGNFTFNRCVFEKNLAIYGTTFYAAPLANSKYDLTITNSLFKANMTKDFNSSKSYGTSAGWIRGLHPSSEVNAKLINNTYVNNQSFGTTGGDYPVIGASRQNGVANVEVANCIFWGNKKNNDLTSPEFGKTTTSNLATVTVSNSIGQANFSLVPTANKTNVSTANPLFNADFTLPNYSYALNSGDNTKLNASLTKDLLGNTRVVGGTIDMGCYENTTGVNPYATATRLYVTETSSGTKDGLSWSNALTDLRLALDITKSAPLIEEVWIAKGIYKPNASNKSVSFEAGVEGLKIYGGFAGTEINLADRDMTKIHTDNATILSGDLSDNDIVTNNVDSAVFRDNTHHIVQVTKKDVLIAGVTISGAVAFRDGLNRDGGAITKAPDVETLTVENCVFKGNKARHSAGISLLYNNTTVRGNFIINRCVFDNNIAAFGAAFYSSPAENAKFDIQVTNSLFSNNKSTSIHTRAHGATGGWLTAYNTGTDINAKFINNTYVNSSSYATSSNNFTGDNSVLALTQNDGTLTAEVSNTIFWNNKRGYPTAEVESIGKATHTTLGSVSVFNSIDVNDFTYVPSASLKDTFTFNPQFVSSTDFTLTPNSPAKDAGDNSKVLASTTKDLTGNQRIFNTTVDIGAYEINGLPKTLTLNATNGSVSSNPSSSNGLYNKGTVVELSAVPDAGFAFVEWTGDVTGTTSPINVTMDDDKTVTAVFATARNLTITGTNGTVTTNPTSINGTVPDGATVTLTATPDIGYVFKGWSGDLTGITNPTTLVMNADKAVTAIFEALPIYVDNSANGNNDGSSWTDAYTDLQMAIDNALSHQPIWVAEGTYNPTTTNTDSRKATFLINKKVKIYGSLPSGSTSLMQQDITNHPTILSGDLNGDDGAVILETEPTRQDNAYHVVTVKGDFASGGFINGFTITGGNANGLSNNDCSTSAPNQFDDKMGAGVYSNPDNANRKVYMTFKNCIVENNTATNFAAFSRFNPCGSTGTESYIDFINSIIRFNFSKDTEAMNYSGSQRWGVKAYGKLINTLLYKNSTESSTRASAIYINSSGAPRYITPACHLTMINCTISGNRSVSKKAINMNMYNAGGSMYNNIIYGNGGSNPIIFSGQQPAKGNNIIEGGQLGGLSGDPKLDTDYTLSTGSAAIDAGDNAKLDAMYNLDLKGNPRIYNTTIDLGAYEYGSTLGVDDSLVVEEGLVTLYPNPVNNILFIKTEVTSFKATVYSVLGKKVLETDRNSVNVSGLKSGVYLLTLKTDNALITKRFIKQ